MHAREYVVSGFALIILIFFCWPLFALAGGISLGAAPDAAWMRLAVGMTNNEIANTVHSLLLPLLGAVIVFRGNEIASLPGVIMLAIMGVGIIAGFFTFAFMNPAIMGNSAGFKPYLEEYGEMHTSILSMTSMLILLFLAKLGLDETPKTIAKEVVGSPVHNTPGTAPSAETVIPATEPAT